MIIHFAPDVVPDRGHELPLVDETRAITIEQHSRCHEPRGARLVVDVETHLAPYGLPRGLGLAAPPGALDEYRPGRSEAGGEFCVDDTGAIDQGPRKAFVRLVGAHLEQS